MGNPSFVGRSWPRNCIRGSSTLRPMVFAQTALFQVRSQDSVLQIGRVWSELHLSRHAPPALNARGEGRWERVLVCVRTEGWAGENGRSAPRSHSPSLGAAALSARSGAESRAPPGAGERPLVRSQRGSRPHRDSSPRRAPLTRPRPPAAASGGRGAGRETRGAVRRRLPSVPGEGRSGRAGERESPTDRLPKSCMQPVGGRASRGWGSCRSSAAP